VYVHAIIISLIELREGKLTLNSYMYAYTFLEILAGPAPPLLYMPVLCSFYILNTILFGILFMFNTVLKFIKLG
jgi:hypothetical protein